jgi:hypothetical protein
MPVVLHHPVVLVVTHSARVLLHYCSYLHSSSFCTRNALCTECTLCLPRVVDGDGFSATSSRLSVYFVGINGSMNLNLTVINSTFHNIVVRVPAVPARYINGTYNEYVGRIAVEHNFILAPCPQVTCDSFAFAAASTPTIDNVQPLAVTAGAVIDIIGSGFTADTQVMLDKFPCIDVQVSNDSFVQCIVPSLDAGNYKVSVYVPGVGAALAYPADFKVKHTLQLHSVSQVNSSLAGGQIVTVFGEGFADSMTNMKVKVNGNSSVLLYVNHTAVTFVVPSLLSPTGSAVIEAVITVEVMHNGETVTANASTCADSSLCRIWYDPALTPTISSVSPTSGTLGTVLTIKGTNFGTNATDLLVVIGGVPCAINATTLTSSQFLCTVGETSGGQHAVYLTRSGFGSAARTKYFTAQLSVYNVTSTALSFGGGNILTINGSGFGTRNLNGTGIGSVVSVCNTSCTVLYNSYNTIQCRTNAIVTETAQKIFKHVDAQVLTGTPSGSSSNVGGAFDGRADTYSSVGTSAAMYVQLDLGAASRGLLTTIRFFPRLSKPNYMLYGYFAISNDSVSYSTVYTISRTPHEGWNAIVVNVTNSFRYIRYYGPTGSNAQVAELEYVGYMLRAAVDSTATSSTCDVFVGTVATPRHESQGRANDSALWAPVLPGDNLQILATSTYVKYVKAADTVVFDVAATPVVTGVSPIYGTALGGTSVTIDAMQLPSNLSDTTVVVNGYSCSVTSTTSSSITCDTSARGIDWYDNGIQLSWPVQGTLGEQTVEYGNSISLSTVEFRYLDKWSALSSWDNV